MQAASETQQSSGFPRGIAREVTPLSMWGGDTLVYKSIFLLSLAALPLVAVVNWRLRGVVAWPQLGLAAATLVGSLLCHWLSVLGRRDVAAGLLVGVIWCSATTYALNSGYGMHSSAIFMYLPCVLYTALFFGLIVASAELALTITALVLMYLAEESGQLGGAAQFAREGTNFNFLIGVVLTSIGTLVVGVIYHRRVEREAARVVAEAEQRRVAMERTQTAQAQLETAHAALVAANAELAARGNARRQEIARAGRELELLHAALAKDLPAARRAGSAAMTALLAALEELASYGSRPLRNERLDLSALAREAVRGLRARPDCAHISFEVESGLRAFGDREMAAALLRHLVERAARACRGESGPWVHVGAGTLEGLPVFFVRDNGPGMSPAQREQLFRPFGQGTAEPDTAAACARLIAECHGGNLKVESAPGKGTTFYFSLPA